MCAIYSINLLITITLHSNNSHVLGNGNSNIPTILGIIATVCVEDALIDDEQVHLRLLSIARHIQVCVCVCVCKWVHVFWFVMN